MPQAARQNDVTAHGSPLNPGPGCLTVNIGFLPAWRALPSGMANAVEGISNAMDSFMKRPQMTPADATASLVEISAKLAAGGAAAAVNGAPAAAGTASTSVATLNATNAALTTTWTTASVVPGGQPAANIAYTEGIKAAAAVAASAVLSAMAGLSDMHICPLPVPIPPHGPGFVTKGSSTVNIGNLPAARQGDRVFEACGGPDPIALGCLTVNIGDFHVPGFMEIVDGVNPLGSVVNCGNIVDAVIARLTGTDPNAASPANRDGTFDAIATRHGTAFAWNQSFQGAFDAVQRGGDGTTALVGIQYSGGNGSHIVVMTNRDGRVGIAEGQNWGASNPREVITSPERANQRYNSDGGSNVGVAVLPGRPGARP